MRLRACLASTTTQTTLKAPALGLLLALLAAAPQAVQAEASLASSRARFVFNDAQAALSGIFLLDKRFRDDKGEALNLVTTTREAFSSYRVSVEVAGKVHEPRWKRVATTPSYLSFASEVDGLALTRSFSVDAATTPADPAGDAKCLAEAPRAAYALRSRLCVRSLDGRKRRLRLHYASYHYMPAGDAGGGFLVPARAANAAKGVCRAAEDTERKDHSALLETHGYGPAVTLAGVETGYFAMAVSTEKPAARCGLVSSKRGGTPDEPAGYLFKAWTSSAWQEVADGARFEDTSRFFAGPKLRDELAAAGPAFPELLDLGFFASLASGLSIVLAWIQGYVGNWGLAIILLTLLVKLVLYPLTEKSFQSMARMRQLKPEMDKLAELYGDDREKKGQATIELYRKHKINPLGGCLPSLLQLPVWFSLYTSLSTNVELYHAPFALWWVDLSAPDPYFVLPLLLGLLMYVQQRITPTAVDPAQAKMMLYAMPTMITVFMLFLPAGLCLYMVTNSALGMFQQRAIQLRVERQSAQKDTPEVSPGDALAAATKLSTGRNQRGRTGQ